FGLNNWPAQYFAHHLLKIIVGLRVSAHCMKSETVGIVKFNYYPPQLNIQSTPPITISKFTYHLN
ncbi:hypothetical protein B9K06_25580, partial [Bacillus sp. OG2]